MPSNEGDGKWQNKKERAKSKEQKEISFRRHFTSSNQTVHGHSCSHFLLTNLISKKDHTSLASGTCFHIYCCVQTKKTWNFIFPFILASFDDPRFPSFFFSSVGFNIPGMSVVRQDHVIATLFIIISFINVISTFTN